MGLGLAPRMNLISYPSGAGSTFIGAAAGPVALRHELEARLRRRGYDVAHTAIPVSTAPPGVASCLADTQELKGAVARTLACGGFPISIGGDHSMAIGSIAAAAEHCAAHHLKLGVLWVDAHSDYNTPASSPSGNIHGMPLAALVGDGYPGLALRSPFALDPENVPARHSLRRRGRGAQAANVGHARVQHRRRRRVRVRTSGRQDPEALSRPRNRPPPRVSRLRRLRPVVDARRQRASARRDRARPRRPANGDAPQKRDGGQLGRGRAEPAARLEERVRTKDGRRAAAPLQGAAAISRWSLHGPVGAID